jgi:hypothetical protein
VNPPLGEAVVRHHLRLFGLAAPEPEVGAGPPRLTVRVRPGAGDAGLARALCGGGGGFVAVQPDPAFLSAFGVRPGTSLPAASRFVAATTGAAPLDSLRTLHRAQTSESPAGEVLLRDAEGRPVWLWLSEAAGGLLLVGTDLPADLVRYRQGDPGRATDRSEAARWGFDSERPNYLFDAQIEGEPGHARFADEWAELLARVLSERLRLMRRPMLPGGAPGAVLITGDDDQALLEKYEEQLALLGGRPITYFMHPQTRHTARTARLMFAGRRVELGLHPDALDAPGEYGARLREQTAWFRARFGSVPESLRNHGFLNDGYWGHLPAWLEQGFRLSSNLPGLDGRVLNGSLLPARLAAGDALTPHWSLLTLFGDGMVYALGMSGGEAAERILDAGRRVRASGIPGVVVLNLHPQNVADTAELHHAALRLADEGFLCWTVGECLAWYASLDLAPARAPAGIVARARSLLRRIVGGAPA